MAQDIVNNNQGISYTNLDFSSIYTEVLELVKKLTYKWDPSISDESDPGVILVKLSALIADKCNYNIDKSILEAFPLSVTQNANARQLYEQLGYCMNWYEAASVPIVMNWINQGNEINAEIKSYTIPKFTPITNDSNDIIYSIVGVEGADGLVISDGELTTDSKELRMIAMEGTATDYTYLGDNKVVTSQMVDKNTHRIYFDTNMVAQNGVFITNTGQANYAEWDRVDNIYEQSYNDLRYKFGYDQHSNSCYLEFPDNYSELIGDGIEITYLLLSDGDSGVLAQSIPSDTLTQFIAGIIPIEDSSITLNQSTVAIHNYAQATGHRDVEDINLAYENYKKTVGTFKTLITLRDYLNYIRSQDLDICSNAFVCDRTNDVQSVYKVVSKQKGLDSILVNVEQIIDKTVLESNFNYSFVKSSDTNSIGGKTYYTITNDILEPVANPTGGHPRSSGWYEFSSRVASSHDALDAFSLKFYLLRNAVSLDTKRAFNETFEMSNEKFDMDSLLENTSHLEHTYEDILPLGENTYTPTKDLTFLANKSYYKKSNDNIHYELFTNYTVGGSTSSQTTTTYEIDVEALLPHTVFFKNIYPLNVNITTYDNLNTELQEDVKKKIINALYAGVNSSQINFGDPIDLSYLEEIIRTSDDRVRSVSFDGINYITKAIYYDELEKTFKSVTLPSSIEDMGIDQKDNDSIISNLIAKDVICKSILAGATSLLVPDDVFTFHLNQKFINYYDDITSITSQAVIDIGGSDALTTYSSDFSNPTIRQSYTLKPNEVLSLYRPRLDNVREFTAGIHYEYFLYNDIQPNQSYELSNNEYIIFYQSYFAGDSATGQPDGFYVYACTNGVIINPSMYISAQTNLNSLSNFAKAKVLPYFETSTDNLYETSTYAVTYVTELFNNSTIRSNAISGTNTIKLQSMYQVELNVSDNYKFFWALNTPDYSNDGNIKTFTLFPDFDISTDRLAERSKNSYTLKSNEVLYYVDSAYSNLAVLGPGTTIYRHCGINSEYDDDNPETSFEYVNITEFENGSNDRFKDGILEKLVNSDNEIDPHMNGWYEKDGSIYTRTTDTTVNVSKDYYVLVMDDNAGLYKRIGDSAPYQHASTLQTSNVFSEVNIEDYMSQVNPKTKGFYEIVSSMTSGVTDYYALSTGASYNDYLRYTISDDTSILSRYIFDDANYSDVDISNINTYKSISITNDNASNFDYIYQRLLTPSNGYLSYKAYYSDDSGTRITDIKVTDNPQANGWYAKSGNNYVLTNDKKPTVLSTQGSLEYPTTITSDYCFETVDVNSWNSLSFGNNGYFYKINKASSVYIWDPTRNTVSQNVENNMLADLLRIYKEAKGKYLTDYSGILNYMTINWNTSISYNHPFKLEDKLGWRTKVFKAVSSGQTATHLGLTTAEYITIAGSLPQFINNEPVEIYPRYLYVGETGPDVIISANAINYIPQGVTPTELVVNTSSEYIEIFDRTGTFPGRTDQVLVQYLEYLYNTFNGNTDHVYKFGMEWIPNIYKFKDLYRRTSKTYYTPNLYVQKSFDKVDPWTCEAMDQDELALDPINMISDKWQSIQTNTSITIVQNDIWSFAEGDTLRFEAPVSSQNSIIWPRFGNTEIPLDFSKYSVSYQRNGASIEDLDRLILEGHEWQGYSNLLLNTSSREGQKLESNHSIILYSGTEQVAIINGSDYENVTFQLKTPVSNVAGRHINVTTEDIYGEAIPNKVYEFVPLVDSATNYKYNSDNTTYAIFNVSSSSIVNTQVRIPVLLPQGNYILPVYTQTPGVNYSVSKYIEATGPNNFKYCANMSPDFSSATGRIIRITHKVDSNSEPLGEQLYGYNKDRLFGNSIINTINNTDYNYLDFSIDINPESFGTFIKVKLPAYLSEMVSNAQGISASPSWFGWYTKSGSSYTASGSTSIKAGLLETVTTNYNSNEWLKTTNPFENGWYEKILGTGTDIDHYVLTSDTSPGYIFNDNQYIGKTYYKDKDYYIPIAKLGYPILKINATNPLEDINAETVNIIFEDVFKYNNNPIFDNNTFNDIKTKLKRLDVDSKFNYAFKPDENDFLNNPLIPKLFFEKKHPFNPYTIAQLDFDNIDFRFPITNTSRR